jgi:hypothetical protein
VPELRLREAFDHLEVIGDPAAQVREATIAHRRAFALVAGERPEDITNLR